MRLQGKTALVTGAAIDQGRYRHVWHASERWRFGRVAGTLSIMVGGDEDTFKHCMPIFQVLGKTIVRVGESGAGQIVRYRLDIVVGHVLP